MVTNRIGLVLFVSMARIWWRSETAWSRSYAMQKDMTKSIFGSASQTRAASSMSRRVPTRRSPVAHVDHIGAVRAGAVEDVVAVRAA